MTSSASALIACTLVVALAGCVRPAQRPDGQSGTLPVGSPAPEVVGYDAAHKPVSVSSSHGHPVVVYFYPRDGSPGCTKEACAFRNVWDRYVQANVTVIGVSTDSPERHQNFLRDKHLPFALASDESGVVANAYGVGRAFWGESRISFLVDGNGKIAHVWNDVDPGVHANEVLAEANKLALPALPNAPTAPAAQ